jgi:lipopolysaccharide export system permease protein
MKTLHKFILKSYVGPFVMTFFIAMFVFFMMFIFKYIDDFVGKGLGAGVLSELFFYFSLTTIPMALPLAVLLSSLMTFGNLGEHFELSALKSAGLSLQRIMLPLVVTIILLSIAAFYFSNNVLPQTNLRAGSLLYDVRESKPALMFKDGVFNNSIEGFSIRVGKKEQDGKTLKDVMIYDHSAMQGNNKVMYAQEGKMEETADKMYLVLKLYNGVRYEEILDNPQNLKTHPLIRNKFEESTIRYDLSTFKMSRTSQDLFKSNYQMLNLSQLQTTIDSLQKKVDKRKIDFGEQLQKSYYNRTTEILSKLDADRKNKLPFKSTNDFLSNFTKAEKVNILESASNIVRSAKAYTESVTNDYYGDEDSMIKYNIEWHRKFTLSIACIVLFFIGAPLGAIIRKGGLGMPVVISVIFFISFHILSITGEKLAKEGSIPVYQGMWMATCILLPIGIFLTYKATADATLFDFTELNEWIKKRIAKSKKKKEIS